MPNINCFSRDGTLHAAEAGANETVLDALLLNGCAVPYCCMVGICGMCKADLKQGQVVMNEGSLVGLSEDDRNRGRILMCQSVAATDCTMTAVHSSATGLADGATAQVTEVLDVDGRWAMCQLQIVQRAPGFELLPGQHSLLEWKGQANDPLSVRAYVGSRTDGTLLDFYIDRQALALSACSFLQGGALVTLQASSGMVARDLASRGPALLVAEGAGVVPWVSALQHLDTAGDRAAVAPHLVHADGCLEPWILTRARIEPETISVHGDPEQLAAALRADIHQFAASGVSPKAIRAFVYAGQPITAAVREMLLSEGLQPWRVTVDAVPG